MFKLKNFAIILLGFSTFFTSCEKDSAPPKNIDNKTSVGTMKAMVDGTAWTGTEYSGEVLQGRLKITGKDASGRTITITVASSTKGNYLLETGTVNVGTFQAGSGEPVYSSSNSQGMHGYLNITMVDPANRLISGDFNFEAFDPSGTKSVMISGGEFNNIQFTPDPMMANSALIDEEPWEAQGAQAVFNGGKLTIGCFNADGSYIVFGFPENVTPGTYNFSSSGGNYTATYRTIFGDEFKATSGMVSLIERNSDTRTIRGTYSFIAENLQSGETRTITEGRFAVTY